MILNHSPLPIGIKELVAERVGFEPTDLAASGFQDQRTKPGYATSPKKLATGERLELSSLRAGIKILYVYHSITPPHK